MHMRYFQDAMMDLEVLREQAPDEANVWFLLGKCHKGLGEKSEALRALTTALNLDPKVSETVQAGSMRDLRLTCDAIGCSLHQGGDGGLGR